MQCALSVQQKIRDGMQKTFAPGDEPLLQLPSAGVSADDLRKKLAFKVCLCSHTRSLSANSVSASRRV